MIKNVLGQVRVHRHWCFYLTWTISIFREKLFSRTNVLEVLSEQNESNARMPEPTKIPDYIVRWVVTIQDVNRPWVEPNLWNRGLFNVKRDRFAKGVRLRKRPARVATPCRLSVQECKMKTTIIELAAGAWTCAAPRDFLVKSALIYNVL